VGRLAIPSGVIAVPIGPGGTIAITATDITLGRVINGLLTDARGSGPGGDLTLQAPIIQLRDGATIAAASTGTGNAGNITITATDTFLSDRGTVTTAALRGDGGNIQVTAPSLIRLRDSEITALVGGGAETVGGNITLESAFVVLENSQIRANAVAGRGGNIQITAGVFLADPASQVSASSARGINGEVDIRAPIAGLSGIVTPLPQQFTQAATLLRDRCAARLQEGTVSSLVERGRDGVPANPDGVLPSQLYKAHAESSKPPRIGRQGKITTASAQRGFSRDADGHLQIKDWPVLAGSPLAWEQECAGR
jgi:large exoprotein involved in heme utilization and adhesion